MKPVVLSLLGMAALLVLTEKRPKPPAKKIRRVYVLAYNRAVFEEWLRVHGMPPKGGDFVYVADAQNLHGLRLEKHDVIYLQDWEKRMDANAILKVLSGCMERL